MDLFHIERDAETVKGESDYRRRVGDRPERIYYHLEDAGREELDRLIADYAEFSEAVKIILNYAGDKKMLQKDIV